MTGKKGVFDFLKDKEDETATGGDPVEAEVQAKALEHGPEEIATGGSPEPVLVHQGLTKAQVLDGQRQAESPRGLDMDKFMKKTGIGDLNFEELLKYKA